MKKTIYLLICSMLICLQVNAQTPNIIISPQNQCYSVSGNSAVAYPSPGIPGASSYTWSVSSPSNCMASVNTASNGSIAYLTYSCCGIYTITCSAYSGSVQIWSSSTTSTVNCGPNINTTVSPSATLCTGSTAFIQASGGTTYTWSTGATGPSVSVSPSVTTCYTVTGTNSSGCTSTQVRCISVITPSLSLSGSSITCVGNNAVLSATGANSYTWYPGNMTSSLIIISPSVTTCYTVVGAVAGCSTTASAVRCLTVIPVPSMSLSGNFSICAGNSTTLTASGVSSYTWLPGNLYGSSIVVNPSVTTCYTLVGYSQECTGSNYSIVRCVTVSPTPSINISGNFTTCAGGSATLYASGASNYTWLPGNLSGSVVVVNPSVTTCYTVSSSTPGCSTPASAIRCVTVNPTPSLSLSGSSITCVGNNAVLSATGANSYTWYPGNITNSIIVISPSVTTCYTVVGAVAGCSTTASAVRCITVIPVPSMSLSGNFSICAGNSTTLTASGVSSYTWLPGNLYGSSIVVNPSVTTCYTLVGYSQECTGSNYSIVRCVTVSPTPSINISGNFTTCTGGSATLSASGASNYTWLPGNLSGSVVVVNPSVTTCYTVSGSTSGCSTSASAIGCVTVNPTPSLSLSGSSITCVGNNAVLSATGANSYTWYPGNMTSSLIIISPSVTTCYTVVGAVAGCSTTASAVRCITVIPVPSMSLSGNFSICAGNSTTLTASGVSSYTWLPGNLYGSSIVVNPSVTTCYTLVGYSQECTGSNYSIVRCVTVSPTPSINISGNFTTCTGGSATLSASGASNYTWLPGNLSGSVVVVNPSVTTCYTVSGSTSGCSTSASAIGCVTVNPIPYIYILGSFTTCAGGSTTLSAIGADSYTWHPGNLTGSSIVASPSTTTCYTVTGATSCSTSASAIRCVTVGPAPVISVSGNTAVCAGNTTTLTASGATSYTWFTSQGTFTSSAIVLTPSATTCYSLIGSNGQGCNAYSGGCVTVSSGSSPSITVGGNTTVCNGQSTVLFAGGASTYTWLPGNLTGSFVTITPSTSVCYTVVGTASNGCVGLGYKCVQAVPKPTVTTTSHLFCSGTNGTLQAQGANTYSWLPFNLTGSMIAVTPSASGCYTVIGTDVSGCSGSAIGCYSVLPSPNITTSGTQTVCPGSSATISASGANSYLWFPGNVQSSHLVVTPSITTCYTVIGTNNTCSSAAVACVSVVPGANISISGANSICSGSSANLLVAGANTYTWNTGSNSPFITVSPLISTCYTVTGTSLSGCTGLAVKCISVQPVPVITISGASAICPGSNAVLVASGASNYLWSTGSTSSLVSVSPSLSTVYTVTGSIGACSSTQAQTLTVHPKPTVTIFSNDSLNNDSIHCAGTPVHLYANGANSYTWNTGATSPNIVVSPSVTSSYTVVGANSFGCSDMTTITIHVSTCTGIIERSNKSIQLLMYPNPSAGKLTLESDGAYTIRYRVYDIIGRELMQGEFTNSQTLDLSGYANGSYTIGFDTNGTATFKKFILENK